jgi:hypothetical protein
LEEYKRAEALLKHEKGLEVKICLKVFRRKMVLEGERGSWVKVAMETLEREKGQTGKTVLEAISACKIQETQTQNSACCSFLFGLVA